MDERTTEERKAQYDSWMDRLNTGKTFRNWNLFRPQIRTKWSTSAYSYGQTAVEAGVDKDTLEISNSTTSMASVQSYDVSKRRKRVILGIVIGIGSLVAVLIPIILIKYLPKPEPSERVSVVDIEATIDNLQYTDQLADKESPEYRNFTLQFCSEIGTTYRSSDLKDAYDGCVVTEIRNGSIIVFFKVVFVSQQLPTERTVKTSLTAKTEITGTGQVLIALGVYKLRQTTVIVGTVAIVDAEYNPVPKIAYENPCRETTSCETDLAECSGRICVCPSSRYFHQPSDSCILFGSILGGKCSVTCADENADCTGNKDPVCRCKAGYFERGTTCAAKISHGNTCNNDGPSDQCSTYGAVCSGSTCSCHETHFHLEQNDTCIKMGSVIGGSCTDSCDSDNAHCDINSQRICLCDINFYNKDGFCAEKKAFESICVETESSEQCATHGATCSNNKCRCNETHFHYQQNDTCLLLGSMLGERCNGTCVDDNALCDGDQERQCVCGVNFYNKDGVCFEKIAIARPCVENGPTEQCATHGATCNNDKCSCNETHFHFQENDTCLTVGSILGGRCLDVCDDANAHCDEDKDKDRICVCDNSYYNEDGSCAEKKSFDSPCDETGSTEQCATHGAACNNNKCRCNETQFHLQQIDTCLLLGSMLGERCNDICVDNNARCDGDKERQCVCDVNFYNKDGICVEKISITSPCIENGPTEQCATHGATCNSGKCSCSKTQFHFQVNDICLTLGSILGGRCTDVCDIDNAHCDEDQDQLCICDESYYNKDGTCAEMGSILGERCNGICIDDNALCDEDLEQQCVCDVNFYDKDGVCVEKIAFASPCTENGPPEQCATHGATCVNQSCSCRETHFYNQQNDTCLLSSPSISSTALETTTVVVPTQSSTHTKPELPLSTEMTVTDSVRKTTTDKPLKTSPPISSESTMTQSQTQTVKVPTSSITMTNTVSSTLKTTTRIQITKTSYTSVSKDTSSILFEKTSSPVSLTARQSASQSSKSLLTSQLPTSSTKTTMASTSLMTDNSQRSSVISTSLTTVLTSINDESPMQKTTSILVSDTAIQTISRSSITGTESTSTVSSTPTSPTDKQSASQSVPRKSMSSSTFFTLSKETTKFTQHSSTTKTTPATALTSVLKKSSSQTTSPSLMYNSTTQGILNASTTPGTVTASTISLAEATTQTSTTAQQSVSDSVSTKRPQSAALSASPTETTINSSATKTSLVTELTPNKSSTHILTDAATSTIQPENSTSLTSLRQSNSTPQVVAKTSTSTPIITTSSVSTSGITSTTISYTTSAQRKQSTVVLKVPKANRLEIGRVEELTCQINNINNGAIIKFERRVGDITQLICNVTKEDNQFHEIDGDYGGSHISVSVSPSNTGLNVTLSFNSVQCTDAGTYICSIISTDKSIDSVDVSEDVAVFKSPSAELKFPIELREGLWGLKIGCTASLGYPRRNLTLMRRLPEEMDFKPFEPQVQKAAELRWVESNDTENSCITHVEYDFDTPLQGWNMSEIRCAVNIGTEMAVLSDIGVFEIVPKTVCNGKSTNENVQHPFDCQLYITCTSPDKELWSFIHKSSCSNGECWLPDQGQCRTTSTSTTTSTITTTTTTPAPGVPYIKCMPRSGPVKVGNKMEYSCNLKYIDKVRQIAITKFNIYEENQAGILGSLTISTDVTLVVEMSGDDDTVSIIFENVTCKNEGEFTIKINNETSDTVDLRIISDAKMPTLSVQDNIFKSQETKANCSSDVGRLEDGKAAASLEFQIKFQGSNFATYAEGVETISFSSDMCENVEIKQLTFYATDKWHEADMRCVTAKDGAANVTYHSASSGPITVLQPKVMFSPENPSSKIGESLTIHCSVADVSDLTSLRIYREKGKQLLCELSSGNTQNVIDGIDCSGQVSSNSGSLQIVFSSVRCGDEGDYTCEPNSEASTPAVTTVTITRDPTKPSMSSIPRTLVQNTQMLDVESFACEAQVGYPSPGSVILQTNKNGTFETIDISAGTIVSSNCSSYASLSRKIFFDSSWNETELRCAVKDAKGTLTKLLSDEYTTRLLPENYCTGNDRYTEHPFECHSFIVCHGNTLYVNTCGDFCPVITNGTELYCSSCSCS